MKGPITSEKKRVKAIEHAGDVFAPASQHRKLFASKPHSSSEGVTIIVHPSGRSKENLKKRVKAMKGTHGVLKIFAGKPPSSCEGWTITERQPGRSKEGVRIYRKAPRVAVDATSQLVDVMPLWEDSIRHRSSFAVNIARAAPDLLESATPEEIPVIFDLLGKTLALKNIPRSQRESVAEALMEAVFRSRKEIPPTALEVIRRHRNTLEQDFPAVWRHIGDLE